MYKSPLLLDLEKISMSSFTDFATAVHKITDLLIDHSLHLVDTRLKPCKKKNKREIYVKLPADVKIARSQCKAAFDSWKDNKYPGDNEIHNVYRSKRKDYRSHLRCFLNQVETDKIKKICNAASTDEKLFWKLLKGQRSSSQMSSFLVDGKFITDKEQIGEMWAGHFEELGTPSENIQLDSDFLTRVTANVQEIFTSSTDDPSGVLSGALQYEEVARVCSQLKPGVCGVLIDYEHVKFAGPDLWILLQDVYQEFFESCMIPKSLKSGTILPLFKGKGAKANNKDNYGGITLFPTLCKIYEMILLSRLDNFAAHKGFFTEMQFGCKIYEMILLNRLDNFAAHKGFFTEMQFGFHEGVGCTEASFTILETIHHMLERGSKVFNYFLYVRKAFDTVWIDGILYKLFSELDTGGRMWKVIKDQYTNVKAQVLYAGSLSRKIDVSQGTGHGRILAPFM